MKVVLFRAIFKTAVHFLMSAIVRSKPLQRGKRQAGCHCVAIAEGWGVKEIQFMKKVDSSGCGYYWLVQRVTSMCFHSIFVWQRRQILERHPLRLPAEVDTRLELPPGPWPCLHFATQFLTCPDEYVLTLESRARLGGPQEPILRSSYPGCTAAPLCSA